MDSYYEAGDDRFVEEVLRLHGRQEAQGAGRIAGTGRPAVRPEGAPRVHRRRLRPPAPPAAGEGALQAGGGGGGRRRRGDGALPRGLRSPRAAGGSGRGTAGARKDLVFGNDRQPCRRRCGVAREPGAPLLAADPDVPRAARLPVLPAPLPPRRDARYGQAIRAALALYQDKHLEKTENLLDAWGLVHVLFWGSSVLVRDPRGVHVAEGRALAELTPAPFAPEAWQGALFGILDLLVKAQSRPVRTFAIGILERDYADALRGMPLARVRALLRSPHDEVQAFAAKVLKTTRGAASLTVDEWLELLAIDNPQALPILCEMVQKVVSPGRLSLAQCVQLACAKAGPVADLGLGWARKKPVNDAAALAGPPGPHRGSGSARAGGGVRVDRGDPREGGVRHAGARARAPGRALRGAAGRGLRADREGGAPSGRARRCGRRSRSRRTTTRGRCW